MNHGAAISPKYIWWNPPKWGKSAHPTTHPVPISHFSYIYVAKSPKSAKSAHPILPISPIYEHNSLIDRIVDGADEHGRGILHPGQRDASAIKYQSCEFAPSLFVLSLKIAHFKERPWEICSWGSLQRVTMSEWLLSLFTKEQCERTARESSELIEKFVFFVYFLQFSPYTVMPKRESLPSLFAHSLFTKELPWAICWRCSKKERKGDSLQKTSKSRFPSFAHKKQAIRSKNKRAKSKLCKVFTIRFYLNIRASRLKFIQWIRFYCFVT